MARKEEHYNRYGEKDVRPGHFQHGGGIGSLYSGHPTTSQISMPTYQDEYGMNRNDEPLEWSHDPRSEAAHEKHYGKGPRAWLTPERIKERVSEALYFSPEVDASDIDIEIEEGCVVLRGIVDDRKQKKAAERRIENIPGVDDVRNELRIRR